MTELLEISHAEREDRAYREAMNAARIGDRVQFAKLWAEYATLHNQRPKAVVEAMERAKGLR